MKNFDYVEYLAVKAKKAELDEYDQHVMILTVMKMEENAKKVRDISGLQREASEVLYLCNAVYRGAQQYHTFDNLGRLFDAWKALENSLEKINKKGA